MKTERYWNPKNETLTRAGLEALQLKKLKGLVSRARQSSDFHARAFAEAHVDENALSTLEDVRRLPFTTRDQWMDSQAARPPFGELLAGRREDAVRYHLTSGTSGRRPLRVLDSRRDWEWIAECWCYGFWAAGVRPKDTVFFAFSYGSFIGFWGAHYCTEKIGALTMPSGNMNTEMRVRQLVDMEATTVCATPTYALRMAQCAKDLGIDLLREAKVDKVIVSGEPAGSIPETKRLIEEMWGAKCCDTAGILISNASASCVTPWGPALSISSIRRRIGFARASNTSTCGLSGRDMKTYLT